MGISGLWEEVSAAFRPRVTLERFVVDFLAEHGRPPTVAVDAFIFLQGSGAVRNILIKMMNLVALKVGVVVVFDGRFKPAKLRNEGSPIPDWQAEHAAFSQLTEDDWEEDLSSVRQLKAHFRQFGIDYFQAPGEAEAQCAFFQKWGVVDYVVTNDLDVFVFGATKVLRNFNKYPADIMGNSPHNLHKVGASKHYWVTPVHMDDIEAQFGLTRDRLVFLASLRGGDYSLGVTQIGIKNALRLAVCGSEAHTKLVTTTAALAKDKKAQGDVDLDDVATLARACFGDRSPTKLFHNQLWPQVDHDMIDTVDRLVATMVGRYNRRVFGRLVKAAADIVLDCDLYRLYLAPIVAPGLYRFDTSTVSGCDCDTLRLPQGMVVTEPGGEIIPRYHRDRRIGDTYVEYSTDNRICHQEFSGENTHPCRVSIGNGYWLTVKLTVLLCIIHCHELAVDLSGFSVQAETTMEGVHMHCVVYNAPTLLERFPEASENRTKKRPATPDNHVYIPLALLDHYAPHLAEAYQHQLKAQERKRSPFKTLDSFNMCTPKPQTPPPSLPPRKRKKTTTKKPAKLQIGQQSIDSFFLGRGNSPTAPGAPRQFRLNTPPVLEAPSSSQRRSPCWDSLPILRGHRPPPELGEIKIPLLSVPLLHHDDSDDPWLQLRSPLYTQDSEVLLVS